MRCNKVIPLPGYKDIQRASTYCQVRPPNHVGPCSIHSETRATKPVEAQKHAEQED
jgi:hypothetical protein